MDKPNDPSRPSGKPGSWSVLPDGNFIISIGMPISVFIFPFDGYSSVINKTQYFNIIELVLHFL